ncbi:SusC/RagA family TonB-linked outer membrane protein [Sesbania bispinosa]|nr:SusC/RagA family TonB-linked outer membrane protein [Sesbania bispinosa]
MEGRREEAAAASMTARGWNGRSLAELRKGSNSRLRMVVTGGGCAVEAELRPVDEGERREVRENSPQGLTRRGFD